MVIEVEDAQHKALEVRIPNAKLIGPIAIVTDRDELTVWVSDYFHDHFGGYAEVESEEYFGNALDFIDSVISDECIIYWVLQDKKWIKSGIIDMVRIDLLKDVPVGNYDIFIRSWSGTYDQERAIDVDVFNKLW